MHPALNKDIRAHQLLLSYLLGPALAESTSLDGYKLGMAQSHSFQLIHYTCNLGYMANVQDPCLDIHDFGRAKSNHIQIQIFVFRMPIL